MKAFILFIVAIFIAMTDLNSQAMDQPLIDYTDATVKVANGFGSVDEWNSAETRAAAEHERTRQREHDEMASHESEQDHYIAGNSGPQYNPEHSAPAGRYSPTSCGANGFETIDQQNARMAEAVAAVRRMG